MKRSFWLVLTVLITASLLLPACAPAGGEVYTAAIDATWPPFEFTDEDGAIIGFDVDMLNAIAGEFALNEKMQATIASLKISAHIEAKQFNEAFDALGAMNKPDPGLYNRIAWASATL